MTDIQTTYVEESAEVTSTASPVSSSLRDALVRASGKRFRRSRIDRDTAIIEALGRAEKAPKGYGDRWADEVWNLSDMLKGYGFDVAVRIETVLVPRDHADAWRKREGATLVKIFGCH